MFMYPRKVEETKLITRDVSNLIYWLGLLMLIPMFIGILYGEPSWPIYLPLILITSGPAWLFAKFIKKEAKPFTKLTIVSIAVTWIVFCIVGTYPFLFVAEMNVLDAAFESVSSISTAGLTTIQGVESISHSVLFWRAMLAWMGGIGIISIAFYGIMQSESLSKIVLGEGFDHLKPSLINSAREIFKIYSFWTILGIILLSLIGTPLFDSFNISMNAISTTGVDVHSEGWAYYQQLMPETFGMMSAIVAMLMIMGAISFVAHYRVIKHRKLRLYWQDSETRFYIIILLVGVGLISGYMLLNNQNPAPMAYEAISTSTTGGFEIIPYITRDASTFVLNILILLALIGGSSNSAAGGLKAKRILMLLRYVVWKVGKQISLAGTVSHFKYDDKLVTTEEVAEVAVYLFIYATAILLVSGFMMAFDYGPSESFLVVTSAQSGGGVSPIPGWELVPPVKVALIGTMLFGRLEFMPMFALIAYLLRRY